MTDQREIEAAAAIIRAAIGGLVSGVDRFYAEVLYRLRRRVDYDCPSIGVSLENGGTLIYNPRFVIANEEFKIPIMVHECLHLLMDHLSRGQSMGLPAPFINVCADLAVNSLIKDFPNALNFNVGGVMQVIDTVTVPVYKAKDARYSDLEEGKALDWYVAYFKEKGEAPKESDGSDYHGAWSNEPVEASRAAVQRLIEESVKATKQAGQSVPDSCRQLVEALLNNELSWEEELRRFPQTAEVYAKESCRMHRNRRYGTMYPGWRAVRRCSIMAAVDVSGSIDDTVLGKFIACLDEMVASGADVSLVFFDHRCYPTIQYQPGMFESGEMLPGGGGTLFQPVLDRAAELDVDGVVFLTDGMLADQISQPAYPVIWGLLEGFANPFSFGRAVVVS